MEKDKTYYIVGKLILIWILMTTVVDLTASCWLYGMAAVPLRLMLQIILIFKLTADGILLFSFIDLPDRLKNRAERDRKGEES